MRPYFRNPFHTLVESQNEFPDLSLLPADAVEPLDVQSYGLYELQTLVDDYGDSRAGQLLLAKRDPGHLSVPQCRQPGLGLCQ